MKVAIIGSRGIPNNYGGFEELAERLGVFLASKKHEVIVFNPNHHPYQKATYEGVTIIHAKDPAKLGAFGQFIYDLRCILKSRTIQPDIILQLGYTSSSIWFWLLPQNARVITNMDGMEWKRSKYNFFTRLFLRVAEKLAATQSHLLIADHKEIQNYYAKKYLNQTVFIPYGADIPTNFPEEALQEYGVKPFGYHLVIARMEPENHIEEVIAGVLLAESPIPLLVIGNLETQHGKQLVKKYNNGKIIFAKANYNKQALNSLRKTAKVYFHGHSVGGTNPSLLEAMACGAHIAAHNNPFNKGILGKQANYFSNAKEVALICDTPVDLELQRQWQKKLLSKVRTQYNWRTVADQYEISMTQLLLR